MHLTRCLRTSWWVSLIRSHLGRLDVIVIWVQRHRIGVSKSLGLRKLKYHGVVNFIQKVSVALFSFHLSSNPYLQKYPIRTFTECNEDWSKVTGSETVYRGRIECFGPLISNRNIGPPLFYLKPLCVVTETVSSRQECARWSQTGCRTPPLRYRTKTLTWTHLRLFRLNPNLVSRLGMTETFRSVKGNDISP